VAREGGVFVLETPEGMPVFVPHRIEVVPFWSSRRRVEALQRTMLEYALYSIRKESREEFVETTLPWLEEQHIHIGLNWNGENFLQHMVAAHDVLMGLQVWSEKRDAQTTLLESESHHRVE
jgi:hypothetical protein